MNTGTVAPSGGGLLQRVSRAMFWNAALLPVVTAVNLAAAVIIRRGFGLESAVYDVALGLVNTIVAHSALGMPAAIGQFVPALERSHGSGTIRAFVLRVSGWRLALLMLVLLPVNIFAAGAAEGLGLGAAGVMVVRIVTVLALLRAISDLAIRTLQALMAHGLANLVQLCQALALVAAAALALAAAAAIPWLLGALAALSAVVSAAAGWIAWRAIGSSATPAGLPHADPAAPSSPAFRRFSLFMYSFEASNYFATPAFASVALAAVAGTQAAIALFNVAFQIPLMVVTVLLAGFQGLYRPLLAGVLAERSPDRLRTTFVEISKVQAALLLPASIGLGLLLPDLIALLFTTEFSGAGPLARVLCGLLFAEALFNLGHIVLSVDRRYGLTIATQALRVVGAPAFVLLAARGEWLAATAAFGAGRFVAALAGYLIARRLYAVAYPWAFTLRVALASAPMAAAVAAGRALLPAGWMTTAALAAAGAALTLAGARLFGVIGSREADLLARAGLPGTRLVLDWLAPRRIEPRC